MTKLLIRLFARQTFDCSLENARYEYGRLAGWVGILSNVLLFLVKLFTGLFTGSISIMADAVNNLSDSATSGITLAAFRLSAMPADEEHPYGHARFEYVSAMIVSCVIIAIGTQFLFSSMRKAISPDPVIFSPLVAILLLISISIKLWQQLFYRTVGTRIDSQALLANSTDSRNDAITTFVVLLGSIIAHFTDLLLDGILGLFVALFVIWSGVSMLREALNPLLGSVPTKELVDTIHRKIRSYPSVYGMHDLMVHNYGHDRCFASVHVELPASQNIMVSHEIIDEIERDFLENMHLHMVIHLDPVITNDPKVDSLRKLCSTAVSKIDPVLTIHDFRIVDGPNRTNLIFDVTVPPRYKVPDSILREQISRNISEYDSSYYTIITLDRSYVSTMKNP
ncbi:cation diffusion facilitator family transporter [Lachnospiraceae bacterium ZAX-1]